MKLVKHFIFSVFLCSGPFVLFGQQDHISYTDDGITTTIKFSPELKQYLANQTTTKPRTKTAVAFTSSNLPIIVIKTNGVTILDEPKVIVKMGIINNGPGKRNALTDTFAYYGNIAIEIRGSSSQIFPKKQYGFELRAADANNDTTASLMGLPPESDWIISAPYTDKSFLRDYLSYYLGRKTGHYAPRTVFCEMVINDEYLGLFHLTEKIKRGKNRVDIKKLTITANSGDSITGGYILKIDKDISSGNGWSSIVRPQLNVDIWIGPDYPKQADITTNQFDYIKNFVTQFEASLNDYTFANPITGYRKYLDVPSFIDFFIIQELGRNVDGYRISTFFNKDRDSQGNKLHAGPLWDFNLCYGNADYCDGGLETGWAYQFNNVCSGDGWQVPFWWSKLLTDPYYSNSLYCRWKDLRSGPLHADSIANYIDARVAEIYEAQARNFQVWPILGTYVWPNRFYFNTFDEEITYLKTWINSRLTWLDNNITGTCATGIDEVTGNLLDFTISPNPVTENSLLRMKLAHSVEADIQVINILGVPLCSIAKGVFREGMSEIELRPEQFSQGVNFVSFCSVDGSIHLIRKVIKQ